MKRILLALIGGCLIVVVAYRPMVRIEPMGAVSFDEAIRLLKYFGNTPFTDMKAEMNLFKMTTLVRHYDTKKNEAYVLFGVMGLAVLGALIRVRLLVWLGALSALGTYMFSLINMALKMMDIRREFSDIPALGERVIKTVIPDWTMWGLLGGGVVLLILAGIFGWARKGEEAPPEDDEPDGRSEATQRMVRYKMGEGVIPRATG